LAVLVYINSSGSSKWLPVSRTASIAAHVVVPLNYNGGSLRGRQTIWGGRVAVRAGLTIATLASAKPNPVIRAAYRRFRIAAKAPKSPSSRASGGNGGSLNAMTKYQCPWRLKVNVGV